MRIAVVLAIGCAICGPAIALADGSAETEARLEPGPLPATAALFGGVLAPGAGHAVGGDWESAKSLLKIRGLGLLIAGAGGAWLGATGASRRGGGLPIAMMVAGGGLMIIPWWADIYGSVGGGAAAGIPRVDLPRLELGVSYANVRDPQFEYEHFAVTRCDLGIGSFRVRPTLWVAVDSDNVLARIETAYRLRGPGAKRPSGDGSRFELRVAAAYHRYPEESFSVQSGEVSAAGRYDMARVSESLSSTYADMWLGLALERIDFDIAGASPDYSDLLLGGFAYGMYLGRRGEIEAFYEHRRDEYAGGLSPGRENGSGFLGNFGARGHLYVTRHLGLTAEYAAGAAHVAQVGLRGSFGGAP